MLWLQRLFIQPVTKKLGGIMKCNVSKKYDSSFGVQNVYTVVQRHTVVSSSRVEELVAELGGQREEEQSQEEQPQHSSQQHRTLQPVVPPGQDTHRPHRGQQPRHAGTGTTAQRDLDVKQQSSIVSTQRVLKNEN